MTWLPVGTWRDLAHQERLTALLSRDDLEPVYREAADAATLLTVLEDAVGAPVALTASGPARSDRQAVGPVTPTSATPTRDGRRRGAAPSPSSASGRAGAPAHGSGSPGREPCPSAQP